MPEKQVWLSGQPGGWRRRKVSGQKLQQLLVDWAFMSRHCVNGENTARVTKWCDGLPKAFQSTRSRLVGETISNSFIAKMSTSAAQ